MGLQMGQPAERGKGVDLVRQAEGRLVAAEAVVAVEQAGRAEAMDAGPEIVGRMPGLGRAGRGGPAPVVGAVRVAHRQRPARAADRGAEGAGGIVEALADGARRGGWHPATIPGLKYKSR
jgi:hypothetical protein